MKNIRNKIIIAGGGTGGHIYPAISLAQALVKLNSNTDVLFVGTSQGLESKIIPKAGYNLQLIQSGKLNFKGQFLLKLKTLLKIPVGLIQSLIIIFKFKPDFILGVGGYASAPMLLAASLACKSRALWEPNAHPGMANRLLSHIVNKSYVVFADAKKYLASKDIQILGMPLRSEVVEQSQNFMNKVEDHTFSILCFGGSQGSQFLNDRLSDLILENPNWHSQIKVYHQTGVLDFQRIKSKYNNLSCVEVFEYIYDMPSYYKKVDLLFCRGGASTLAEAAAFGVVPLVVPLPAADDHQQKNAEVLVQENAGFMLLQKQFSMTKFKNIIELMMSDLSVKREMSEHLKKLAPKNAAVKIAEDILMSIS